MSGAEDVRVPLLAAITRGAVAVPFRVGVGSLGHYCHHGVLLGCLAIGECK